MTIYRKTIWGVLRLPYRSAPIVGCMGLSRALWVNLEVVLVNDNGVVVAEGICCNTHPQDCIDKNPFGTEDVGVVIWKSLIHFKVPLRRWPLKNVTIERVSLHEHEWQHMQIQKKLQTNIRPCNYETLACATPSTNECKLQGCLVKNPLEKLPQKILLCIIVANCSPRIK